MGGAVGPADAALIAAGVRDLLGLHATYLGVPFADVPTFLSFASVSRTRTLGRNSWAFVVWPTLAIDGRVPFTVLIDSAGGRRTLAWLQAWNLAHESAHFYFGTRYVPRGPLRPFLGESTAEYLALRAVQAQRGDSLYGVLVRGHARAAAREVARSGPFVPLDSVRGAGQIGVAHRYEFGPLLLLALEHYVGADAVRRTLAGLVRDAPAGDVDYAAFRARVARAGGSEAGLRRFEADCLHAAAADFERGCLAQLAAGGGAAH